MALDYECPLAIIGVDPGGTTGVAEYVLEAKDQDLRLEAAYQLRHSGTVYEHLIDVARDYRGRGYNVVFVVEQFDNRPGIVDPDLTPKYIINDIKRFMPDESVIWQTPSQAKNLVKPASSGKADGLKRFGLYQVSKPHANDASRHVLVYAVEKIKHKPTILKGWPKRG